MNDYPDGEGSKQKVYLTPEWAAKQGIDKDFYGLSTTKSFNLLWTVEYIVPVGKTLYITSFSFDERADNPEDAELNQMVNALIMNYTDAIFYSRVGGNGGGAVVFNKPLVFPAGRIVWFIVICRANHDCVLSICAHGYET